MRNDSIRAYAAATATILLLIGSGLSAAEIHVPADQPTIQAAITVSSIGDEVIVAPGTYLELIDFQGKEITVRSSDGPLVTIIDGQQDGPVVTFVADEDASTVLEGFTIRNGRITSLDLDLGGGGIFIQGASPTIRGNIIRENISTWNGAGAFCVNSESLFERNQFIQNIFQAPVADLEFGNGGGLHVRNGAVTVVECVFLSNAGSDRGGAILFEDTQGSSATTTVCQNNTSGFGGAIAIDGNSIVDIQNLLATGNQAIGHTSFAGPSQGLGGAVYIAGPSAATIFNATLLDNQCFQGNNGPGDGGGVYADTIVAMLPIVDSSIVRGNTAGANAQVHPALTVSYCNVQSGAPGTGNFDVDPALTVGPLGAHYLSQIAAGQGLDSPCIDAGNPAASAVPGTTTRTDQASDAGVVDVGFHFPVEGAPFLRADCNSDSMTDIADAIFVLSVLFPAPPNPAPAVACIDACDGNDDGLLNIADAISILDALFGTPPGTIPPPTGVCGSDPTADGLSCGGQPGC
jgi:hypothetical protein